MKIEDASDLRGRGTTPTCEEETRREESAEESARDQTIQTFQQETAPRKTLAAKQVDDSDLRGRDKTSTCEEEIRREERGERSRQGDSDLQGRYLYL